VFLQKARLEIGDYHTFSFPNRGRISTIPEVERNYILRAIFETGKSMSKGEVDSMRTLALAAYPLADLLDPTINHRCNWLVMVRHNESVPSAIALDYFGEHNYRYFFLGRHEAIRVFIKEFPKIQYAIAEHLGDFRLVLPTWQFKENELPNLLGKTWKLRGGKAEVGTRIVLPLKTATIPEVEYDKKRYKIVNLTSDHLPSIKTLLTAYPHHSFRTTANHVGMIDTSTGEVVAMSGIISQVVPFGDPNQAVSITGNLVTRQDYKRQHLAKAVKCETLRRIKRDSAFNQGIAVADVNAKSLLLNIGLGYEPIRVNGGIASFFWCIYEQEETAIIEA